MEKICEYLLVPYKIIRKGKEPFIIKSDTIIDPVTWWFEVIQYNDKKAMTIATLVETTCLVQYPWPL